MAMKGGQTQIPSVSPRHPRWKELTHRLDVVLDRPALLAQPRCEAYGRGSGCVRALTPRLRSITAPRSSASASDAMKCLPPEPEKRFNGYNARG